MTSRGGRDRPHVTPRRSHQIKVRYSSEELGFVVAAARGSGLTPAGYVADAALAAATAGTPPSSSPWRYALKELIEARTQVRRIGVNVNQAARVLNATGEPPPWLEQALAVATRATTRIDAAAVAITALARSH